MSHRGKMSDRLAQLPLLLAERPRSASELADHFDVSEKTIRRDIDTLTPHHPIVSERHGRKVLYCFAGGFRYHPPSFTPAELASLLLAQESLAASANPIFLSPFAQSALSLLPN